MYLLATILRLGLTNVATVALYRMAVKSGIVKKRTPKGTGYRDPLFHLTGGPLEKTKDFISDSEAFDNAEDLLKGELSYFSGGKFNVGNPPDWFLNPMNRKRLSCRRNHWSRIDDFDPEIGDIKTVWEASRFDWALVLARTYCLSGDLKYLKILNNWTADWTEKNPVNIGPNWKCGQEAGIRMMQVLLAALLLGQDEKPADGLIRFVAEHCGRIRITIRYAMAQDNNHGTSEAAALFIGGSWLGKAAGDRDLARKARNWEQCGRNWLENRIRRLVGTDGSFSQYSLNYHRVLVDTLNLVEFWRRRSGLKRFSELFYIRSRSAVEWLYHMVDPVSGDAPNMGANDGSRLFLLSSTGYRDYRPTVQLGAVLFLGGAAYGNGPWNEQLFWLDLKRDSGGKPDLARKSRVFHDGGYTVLYSNTDDNNKSWAVLRFPVFRFRPGHADVGHLDLWNGGVNLLRDSGTYSYNDKEPWQTYFPGTASHNTVQFDGRDQMPRLGRFLFGRWLQTDRVGKLIDENGTLSWTGSYRDYKGCGHKRTVSVKGRKWRIIDEVADFSRSAVVRWRLAPGDWRIDGSMCVGEPAELSVSCSVPVKRFELVEGWESRYYFRKTPITVLEIEVGRGKSTLTTEVRLK